MAMATQSEAGETYILHDDTLYSYCTNWNIILGLIGVDFFLDLCQKDYSTCIAGGKGEETCNLLRLYSYCVFIPESPMGAPL